MKRLFLLLLVAQLFQSCATRTPSTNALLKDHPGISQSAKLTSIPFIKQEDYQCGPSALAMVLESEGHPVDVQTLTEQMYTPGSRGSFSMDLVSTVRRQGMVGILIHDLKSLLAEIAAGHPVVVFQNLGFSWYPNWHYAVALGYDLSGPDLILHSGKEKFLKTDLRMFERSWSQANFWALLVLPPGELAVSADDLAHVSSISGLEQVGKVKEAQVSYQAVLKKWPESLPALIGMGNVLYGKKDFKGASKSLERATKYHPGSAIAWHNLATAQWDAKLHREARVSALRAIVLVEKSQLEIFNKSLEEILK